jgi:hypothetical protein
MAGPVQPLPPQGFQLPPPGAAQALPPQGLQLPPPTPAGPPPGGLITAVPGVTKSDSSGKHAAQGQDRHHGGPVPVSGPVASGPASGGAYFGPLAALQPPAEPAAAATAAAGTAAEPAAKPATRSRAKSKAGAGQPTSHESTTEKVPPPKDVSGLAQPSGGPLMLVFDTGEEVPVNGLGVVGRNPAPPAGTKAAQLVPIADPGRTVSKSHLDFGLDDQGGLWVMDRGSTNGTAMMGDHGQERTLERGAKVAVPVGSVVRFGDRSFKVVGA